MAIHANSDLVGVAWVKGVQGVDLAQVATTRPEDTNKWAEKGFVQLTIVGGSPARDNPLRRPVLQVDAWAVNPNTDKAPWGKAAALAELVLDGTFPDQSHLAARTLVLPAGYHGARVMAAEALSEPRRIEDSNASFARYQWDLLLTWVELPA